MRPTIEEHLRGISRTLDEVATTRSIEASAALLSDAQKQLQRLAGSVSIRGPFLRWDNDAMATLMSDLAPRLPDPLRQLAAHVITADAAANGDEHARNERLRSLMTSIVEALPDDDHGDQARRSIADHLRARAAANPALHKHPQRWWDAPTTAEPTDTPTDKAET